MATKPLIDSLDHVLATAKRSWDESLRILQGLAGDLEITALNDARFGDLQVVMTELYQETFEIKGKGSVARRIQELENQVGKYGNVWMKYHDKIASNFSAMLSKHIDELRIHIVDIFDTVHQSFRRMCDDTSNQSEEEKAAEQDFIEEITKVEIKARGEVEGRMQKLADECKNYGKKRDEDALFVSGND